MAFTTQCILRNMSIVKYMYSESDYFGSEWNSKLVRWNIRWTFLEKSFTGMARQLFL